MKRIFKINLKLTVITLLLAFSTSSFSQGPVDLTIFGGWQMNGKIRFYEGDLRTDDAPLFGATADIWLGHGYGVRLMYSRTDTESHFRHFNNPNLDQNFPIANEWYQIGSIKSMPMGNIEPYGIITLGATRYLDKEFSDSYWRFGITAGLGAKFFFNEKIGISVEGAFMIPMYFQGAGFYFGGGGSGFTTYSSVPMLQGNFNAGLIFRLGN